LNRSKKSQPLSLRFYKGLSGLFGPLADFTLKRRLEKGKEDPSRVDERRGYASVARPEGKLIWIHGASVGESLSIIPLVEALKNKYPDGQILVTSGTITSAQLMGERLPEGAIHQYIPVDHPDYVTRFLNHWQPNAVLFVESELWPNLIQMTAARNIPLALVNGRISPKSYKNWQQRKDAIADLLGYFSVVLGQDTQNTARLAELGRREVPMLGNLKMAAPPLPVEKGALEELAAIIGERPLWLAASTHEGEEEFIMDAHLRAMEQFPDLLTIIAPRHPVRGDVVMSLATEKNITTSLRSKNQLIEPQTSLYIADTLGELGLFYRLSDIAFVGGSLVAIGGHNPLEPARLRAAILHGPHTFNFEDTYADMRRSGGSALVRNERDLAASLVRLLTDDITRKTMASSAENWSRSSAEQVLTNIVKAIEPVLENIKA
jgi:3-deoxy-D-manno-octulosonic-acid transferase